MDEDGESSVAAAMTNPDLARIRLIRAHAPAIWASVAAKSFNGDRAGTAVIRPMRNVKCKTASSSRKSIDY